MSKQYSSIVHQVISPEDRVVGTSFRQDRLRSLFSCWAKLVEIKIGRCIVKRAVAVRKHFDLGWKH